jgi:hypothetical protein
MEEGDRRECQRIVRTRNTVLSVARRAQMLLMAAQGFANRRIALQLGVPFLLITDRELAPSRTRTGNIEITSVLPGPLCSVLTRCAAFR